jgi:hypothetical protein
LAEGEGVHFSGYCVTTIWVKGLESISAKHRKIHKKPKDMEIIQLSAWISNSEEVKNFAKGVTALSFPGTDGIHKK